MPTAEWTLDLARRWAAPTHVRWRRWALTGATVATAMVMTLTTGSRTCADFEPGFCVADPVFPVGVGLLVASVVLLWWSPPVAAGCAAAFVVLVVAAYDGQTATLAAGLLLVLLHLVHLVLIRREAATRVGLAAPAQVAVPDEWRAARRDPTPNTSALAAALLLSVALALVTLVSLVLLVRAMLTDRDELLGEVALVAPDRTIWALATAACLAASLWFAREVVVRRRRSALAGRGHQSGVPVRYVVVDDEVALVLSEQEVIFGRFDVEAGPAGPAEEGAPSERLRPGILVGDLRPGGWCALMAPDGILLPRSALQAATGFPASTEVDEVGDVFVDDEGLAPSDRLQLWAPAEVGTTPRVQLPIVLSLDPVQRACGVAIAVLSLAGAWGTLHYLAGDPLEIGFFFCVCVGFFLAGINFSVASTTVDRDEYVEALAFRRVAVPLTGIVEVRHREDQVALVTEAGDIRFLGPFADAGSTSLTYGLPPGTTAADVATAVEAGRREAAGRPPRTGRPPVPRGYAWAALGVVVLLVRVLTLFVL